MDEHSDLEHYRRNLLKSCFREAAFEGKEAAAQKGLDDGYHLGFLDGFALRPSQLEQVMKGTPETVRQRIDSSFIEC